MSTGVLAGPEPAVYCSMMLLAVLVDAVVGWPRGLFVRIGHPVSWLGRLIGLLDARLNVPRHVESVRRAAGILAVLFMVTVTVLPAVLIQQSLPAGIAGLLIGACLSWPLIAARSLYEHVNAVFQPLSQGNLDEARQEVSRIVGRETSQLDEAGVGRAALESLAENTSDGIIAPVFWGAILGFPGIVAYKTINTLDSMVGHRTERHAAFGWASARLDDAVNFIPARLTGLLFAVFSARPRESLRCMMRDSGHHRSPNAGWPEAAMAGALGVRLSGPRVYADRVADEPWVHPGFADPGTGDIGNALRLYVRSLVGMIGMLALAALALSF